MAWTFAWRRLEHPQQLGLEKRIAFADLVQEERAAICACECPRSVLVGTSESPLHMAEQLRLQQFPWNCGTVDRLEGTVLPATGGTNGPCEHLLARAAFAKDQDGHVPQGSTLGQTDSQPDRLAFADDVLETGHFARVLCSEVLEGQVGVAQKLGYEVIDQVVGNVGLLEFAPVRLKECGWVTTLSRRIQIAVMAGVPGLSRIDRSIRPRPNRERSCCNTSFDTANTRA